jgi:molybdenum cofactor cytidylyltransferase
VNAATSTAAVILAAGSGTRFGGGKLLALIDGKPMLQHVLDLAADADLARVLVVLGADAAAIEAGCTWRSELRVRNYDPEKGISGSIKAGMWTLIRLNPVQRAVMLLGDQPFLRLDQLKTILATEGLVVVPRYGGVPGNPVVLDRSVWSLVGELQGDRGFSQLFASHPELLTYIDVPGANPDIDRRADIDEINLA